MNKGMDRAGGLYLIFMNAGDLFAQDTALQTIRRAAEAADPLPDFIYGDSRETEPGRPDGFYKKARSHEHIGRGMPAHHQAMLYRRAAAGNLRYDLQYKIAADYDFTARFLQQTDKTLYIPARSACLKAAASRNKTRRRAEKKNG